jgi:hypothetical protein
MDKAKKFFSVSGENAVFYLILIFTFLIQLLFSPSQYVNFFYSKTIPLFVVTILGLFFFIFKIFKEGRYKITVHPLFFAGLFIPFWYLISGLFSVNRGKSLIGFGVESDTVSTIAVLFIFAFLVSYFIRAKDRIFLTYLAFSSSYLILATFHILRLFFGEKFLSFGLFVTTTSNTVGKWNEMAIMSSVAILLSLISIEFLKLSRNMKVLSYVVLVFSLFLLAVTNFPLIFFGVIQFSSFTLIGLFALVFFVYFLASSYEMTRKRTVEEEVGEEKLQKRRIPIASLVVLVISVFFTFASAQIGATLQNYFQVSSYEERPTWSWTASAGMESLKNKPLTGYGPNNFETAWAMNKPESINGTAAWNIDFMNAVGYIPMSLFTVGPLGLLGWLAFMGIFIFLGFKALFMKYKDRFSQYITISSFLIALFLWIIALIYVPTIVVLIMTFLFTGLFVGSLIQEQVINEKSFVFETSKAKTFASIMVLVVLLVGAIFWSYAVGQKYASTYFASKGAALYANAQSEEDLVNATGYYARAIGLSAQDAYLRAVSNISLARAGLVLNNNDLEQSQVQLNFTTQYQTALAAANDSITLDPYNYQNYLTRGSVAEAVISLGVPDAYQSAKQNYEQAQKLNSNSPLIAFMLARLEYSNQNYQSAVESFEKVVTTYPYYSNARYYLALSYYQVGRKDDAVTQLQQIKLLNPGNPDIDSLINSIQEGSPAPVQPVGPAGTSTATTTAQ